MWTWLRRIALVAIAGSAVSAALTFWVWVRKMPVKPAADGQPLVDGFDVISVQMDILTLTITAMGIGLGVAAIFGYQALRDAAQATAKRAAREVADKVATAAIAEHIEKLESLRSAFSQSQPPAAPPEIGDVEEVTKEEVADVGAAPRARGRKKTPAKSPGVRS